MRTPEIQFFPTAEGYYDYVKSLYIYQYKDPDAGLMPNSLIIQNGSEIMRTNGIPIQPLYEQLTTKSKNIPQ